MNFSKISEQLSSYDNNGLLDTGRFYAEVRLIINILGIPAYDMTDAVVKLKDYHAQMPCDFYMLDSAWLCSNNPEFDLIIPQPNSTLTIYNRVDQECIRQVGCNLPDPINYQGVILESCPGTNNNEQILEKITMTEIVATTRGASTCTWHNPILLSYKKKKSVRNFVTKDCKNLFAKSPYEISIEQQGKALNLYSTMKEPIIYLKYYRFPVDLETGLPLIIDEPIIQRAIEYHLMYTFFYMAWLNGDDVNIDRKVKDLEIKKDLYLAEAKNYVKLPSFNKMIELMQRQRRKYAVFEIM